MGIDSTQQLKSALAEKHLEYKLQNPQSERLHIDSLAHFPGGNTRTVLHANPYPLVIEKGHGPTLTSVDGHSYIDFLNEYSAGLFGHSNPRILHALQEALSSGWNFGAHTRYEKVLAAKVVERFGKSGVERVRFTNSGTEANTMAIAAATQITGRKKVLVFSGAYHGGTMAFPKTPAAMTTNLPHDWIIAAYNNIDETRGILDSLPSNSLAAILVEPVQGAGGCRPASREFLHFLRQTADEQEAILIVDEVMTSRLGFHGHLETLGLRADMVTLGKYVGGGMSFGAFGGKREIMQLFDPVGGSLAHAGTFNNNVLTMAAGIAGLELYDARSVEALNSLGNGFRRQLQDVLTSEGLCPDPLEGQPYDIVEADSLHGPTRIISPDNLAGQSLPTALITGSGSLINVRFTGRDSESWNGLLYHHLLEHGIYLAARGYMALSLELTEHHIHTFVSAFKTFIAKHKTLLLETSTEI